MSDIVVNPHASQLGVVNAIVGGRGRHYDERFAGPLSVKSVLHGVGTLEVGGTRYEVTPHTALILNDGEEYTIEIDAREPVETFCIFFARGFVEDAFDSATTSSAPLLDRQSHNDITFPDRWTFDAPILAALRNTRESNSDEALCDLANALVRTRTNLEERIARMPLVRAATREEIRRRIDRGVAFIHAGVDAPLSVEDVARESCLSLFHFHRLFTAIHGETPHRYIARLRLERARAMLRDRKRSVAEVALACGYATPSAFSTAYSKHFGRPPRATISE